MAGPSRNGMFLNGVASAHADLKEGRFPHLGEPLSLVPTPFSGKRKHGKTTQLVTRLFDFNQPKLAENYLLKLSLQMVAAGRQVHAFRLPDLAREFE